MRVEIEHKERVLRYHLHLEDEERGHFRAACENSQGIGLVRDTYEVRLPAVFESLHPDAHAVAIWIAVRPAVVSTLSLPFAVSSHLAERMHTHLGISLPNKDECLGPREMPRHYGPALLFSAGVNSMTAALVMPREIPLLFRDRLPHFPEGQNEETQEALISQRQQRWLCADMSRRGWNVKSLTDDHDFLYSPYPSQNTDLFLLPALYLADSMKFGEVALGEVTAGLCRKPPRHSHMLWGLSTSGMAETTDYEIALAAAGLRVTRPIIGLTEVASSRIVNSSELRNRTSSCRFPSNSNYCLRCDQCFRQMLLDHIFLNEEVPAEVIEHFLALPHIAKQFASSFLDQHHVWFYIFQKLRCKHPLAVELRRQAAGGPDLSLLERWYAPSAEFLDSTWRDDIVERIQQHLTPMTAAEETAFQTLELPQLTSPRELLPLDEKTRTSTISTHQPKRPPAGESLDRLVERASAELSLTSGKASASENEAFAFETDDVELIERQDQLEGVRQIYCRAAPSDELLWKWRSINRVVAHWLDPRTPSTTTTSSSPFDEPPLEMTLQRLTENAVSLFNATAETMGFTASWPVSTTDERVLVSLRINTAFVDLYLQKLERNERCFARAGNIAVSYFNDAPPDTTSKKSALKSFLQALEVTEGGQEE